jgi:hypothetical protein
MLYVLSNGGSTSCNISLDSEVCYLASRKYFSRIGKKHRDRKIIGIEMSYSTNSTLFQNKGMKYNFFKQPTGALSFI